MTRQSTERIQRAYSFGPFVLVPERQLLVEGEKPVRLGGRALDVLTALVERPGEVVGKQELISRVWPGISVDHANLKVNMGLVRRALGDNAGPPQYIATVVGRGYRFIAPVISSGFESRASVHEAPADRSHNLPIGTARIVGRDDTITSITQELEVSRLVSIVGAGGVGKTTVALAVAESAIGRFADGVWLIDLVTLKDQALVPNAIASAIGLTAHSTNMMAALCTFLQDRKMLLLLDNCEHLIDTVAFCVQRILASAGSVKILATSREPISVKGERVRRLAGLPVPPASNDISIDNALSYAAVQLFVDHAMDRQASFVLRDIDVPVIGEICRKLDGVALAIELAATRIDAFGPAELLDRLDNRFRLLQGRRAGPERHRTLAATIDWSYDLLSDSERTIMRRLSVFSGTFGLLAACTVTSDEHIDQTQVTDNLGSLVEKSLISVGVFDADMNYRMLGSTRAYALDKLVASGELERVQHRHADYALDIARQANADIASLSSTEWRGRYLAKIDDIRDALTFAFSGNGDEALGVELTVAAVPWWERLSLLEENRVAVERALENRYSNIRTERDNLLLLLSQGATKLFTRGPLPDVKANFLKALEIAKAIGDTELQLECLRGLSQFDLWAGDSRSSLAFAEKVQQVAAGGTVAPPVGKPDGQAGSALHYLGELDAARQQLQGFLDTTSAPNARSEVSRFEFDQRLEARGSLAMVLWLQGFPDKALKMARHQLEEAEASGYAVPYCAAMLLTSASIQIYVGKFEETEQLLDFADDFAAEHGLTLWGAVAACMRVKLHIEMHRPVDLASYAQALSEVRDGGLGLRYAPFLANYGHVLSLQEDADGALACIDEAMDLYAGSGQDWGLPEMLTMKGNFIRAGQRSGWFEAAGDCYRSSIALARKHGSLTWELRSAIQLADIWREADGNQQARDALESAYNRFEEGFWTPDLQRARKLLDGR